jgi:DNA-binding NarL/FixJ family response regulator
MIDAVASIRSVAVARMPEAAPAEEPKGSAISIQLSPEAESKLLKSEGQTIPEIAQKLRIPEDTVSSYLNLLV